jgi:hypothetical protein
VGYRGAFTIDGIGGREGFRPTELNPRNGAGLMTMARGGSVPLQWMLDLLVHGTSPGVTAGELEDLLLPEFDRCRKGGTWRALRAEAPPEEPVDLVRDGDRVRPLAVGESPDLYALVGSSPLGCFVRATFVPERTPAGPSVGPVAAAFWAYADRAHHLGIGPLSAAAAMP